MDFSDWKYTGNLRDTIQLLILGTRSSRKYLKFKNISDIQEMLRLMYINSAPKFNVIELSWNGNQKLPYAELINIKGIGVAFNLMDHSKLLDNLT
jgi:hypothetical protein